MYLNNFSYEQKLAFLAIAVKIINADGILDRREQQTIDTMRIEMGLLAEAKLPNGPLEQIVSVFDTRRNRIYAFIEWIALAYADEKFSGEEQKLLRAIALQFNLDEKEASAIETWVNDYKTLLKDVERFI